MPHTASVYAVAIALWSWSLIKLISRGLFLWNFDLALETVGNGAFAVIVRKRLSQLSTVKWFIVAPWPTSSCAQTFDGVC